MTLYNVVPLFLVLPRCAIGDNQYDISKWITHKRDCNLNYYTGICMPKNALINVGLLLRLKKTTRATVICMLQIWLLTITHQSNWFNESNAIYFACCCLITPHILMFIHAKYFLLEGIEIGRFFQLLITNNAKVWRFLHSRTLGKGRSINKCRKHFPGIPDSKVRGANMGPTWVLSAPGVPHVGPENYQGCYRHRTVRCATNGSHSATTNANLRWSSVSSYSGFSNILDLDFHIVEILKHANFHLLWKIYVYITYVFSVPVAYTAANFCHIGTSNEFQCF